MEVFFIVFAIFAAVTLVFRYAVTPQKPKLGAGERMSKRALDMRIELLAKRCKTTTYGFGVSARALKLKRVFSRLDNKIEKGDRLYGYEYELLDSRSMIAAAERKAKSSIGTSYTLGHVDGYPRVYLLCNEIVLCNSGDITKETLDGSLSVFERVAPLSHAEKQSFVDTMRYCLCAMLYFIVSRLDKPCDAYADGLSDGEANRVDLDRLTDIYYVCGVTDGATRDADAVHNLLEINGVDGVRAKLARAKRLSSAYARTKSIIASLKMLDGYIVELGEQDPPHVKLSRRAVKICNIAPVVVIVALGVLTCIFVEYYYSAVFAVLSILAYAGFRLPLLVYAPSERLRFDFSFFHVRKEKNDVYPQRAAAEIAYFGGEAERIEHDLVGKKIKVYTDNRGSVRIDDPTSGLFFDSGLYLSGESGRLDMTRADGLFLKHMTVYSVCDDEKQFIVRVLSPCDESFCIFDITVVNRRRYSRAFDLGAIFSPRNGATGETRPIENGEAFFCGRTIAAFAFDEKSGYGNDIRNAKRYGVFDKFADRIPVGMTGGCEITVDGFSKKSVRCAFVFGRGIKEVERGIEYALSPGYFSYACDRASEFAECFDAYLPQTPPDRSARINAVGMPIYNAPNIFAPKTFLPAAYGEFTEGGEYRTTAKKFAVSPLLINYITCGGAVIECGLNGISSLGFLPDFVERGRESDDVRAYAVIGENDILWSPTASPVGRGECFVAHGIGYTRYECAFNGCVCSLICYAPIGERGALFELKINNRESVSRNFDIMFCVEGDCDGPRAVVHSSEDIQDECDFKEGYYVYGEIDRVKGFRKGGSAAARAISVNKSVPPCTEWSVLFYATDRAEPTVDLYKTREANTAFTHMFDFIKLVSSDRALGCLFGWSLYKTYILFLIDGAPTVKDAAIALNALKYADTDLVRRAFSEIVSRQAGNGKFEGDNGDALFLFAAVFDYCDFVQDIAFLDEPIAYAPSEFGGVTVSECESVKSHFLRALSAYAEDIAVSPPQNAVKRICFDGEMIKLLHKGVELCKSIEKRSELIKILGIVAARYSTSKKLIKSYKFIATDSLYDELVCARALFLADEYKKGYEVLRECNIITKKRVTEPTCAEYALFYSVVAETLLGMTVRGKRIKLNPNIAENAPDLSLLVSTGGNDFRIDIDNSSRGDEWRTRIGSINYSLNTIETDKRYNEPVVLFKEPSAED